MQAQNIAVKGFWLKDDTIMRVNDLPGAREAENPTPGPLNFENQS